MSLNWLIHIARKWPKMRSPPATDAQKESQFLFQVQVHLNDRK
jgi:hypothetical protein